MDAPHLIVAGTPSIDRIEIRGETLDTVGGSGFITAVAARLTGTTVGLIARVPRSLPPQIAVAFAPGGVDPGGLVPGARSLPGFHISYDAAENATYLVIDSGDEADVRAADVPRRWLDADWVHVGPLAASAALQLKFVTDLRERGYNGGLSAGTFGRAASTEADVVRELFAAVDVAFLNRDEADRVYPHDMPMGMTVCVTDGRAGVRRWDGAIWSHHPTTGISAVDPTGAGDAFIGGYLGAMLEGDPAPVEQGIRTASLIVAGPGAAPVIDRLTHCAAIHTDRDVRRRREATVDNERTDAVATILPTVASGAALDFCGSPFPDRDDPTALNVLTVGTLHQYGFWTDTANGYGDPMWASIDGVRRKGSDFIWHALTRSATADPTILHHGRLAADPLLFDLLCVDDTGSCPIPDVGSHRALQQAYGATIGPLGGIEAIIVRVNASPDPLAAFLETLKTIPGFGEDPLAKKANLLALILANRPERFLDLRGPSSIAPIVDYHIMRTTLRTGCVKINDVDLLERLESRQWVSPESEGGIRIAARDAIDRLCTVSGLDVGAVDGFLFNLGRTLCLETEDPKCDLCPIAEACARKVDLFQPIFRTTAY